MAFCTKCGASIADGAKFCGICGAPVGGAAPVRQAAQPAPQQDNWDSYGDSYAESYGYTPQRQAAPSRRGPLRAFSVIFAIGFLILSVGFGMNIFYNRQVDSAVNESYESQKEYYQKAKEEGWYSADELQKQLKSLDKQINAAKKQSWRVLGPTLRCDVIGAMRASIPDIGDYDRNDYSSDEWDSLKESITKSRESVEDRIKDLTAKEIREYRKDLEDSRQEGIDKAGGRYVWLIICAYNHILMIVGGALALISLIVWIALGGLRGPLSQTTVLPAVITLVVLGIVLMIFSGLIMAPIRAEEMK